MIPGLKILIDGFTDQNESATPISFVLKDTKNKLVTDVKFNDMMNHMTNHMIHLEMDVDVLEDHRVKIKARFGEMVNEKKSVECELSRLNEKRQEIIEAKERARGEMMSTMGRYHREIIIPSMRKTRDSYQTDGSLDQEDEVTAPALKKQESKHMDPKTCGQKDGLIGQNHGSETETDFNKSDISGPVPGPDDILRLAMEYQHLTHGLKEFEKMKKMTIRNAGWETEFVIDAQDPVKNITIYGEGQGQGDVIVSKINKKTNYRFTFVLVPIILASDRKNNINLAPKMNCKEFRIEYNDTVFVDRYDSLDRLDLPKVSPALSVRLWIKRNEWIKRNDTDDTSYHYGEIIEAFPETDPIYYTVRFTDGTKCAYDRYDMQKSIGTVPGKKGTQCIHDPGTGCRLEYKGEHIRIIGSTPNENFSRDSFLIETMDQQPLPDSLPQPTDREIMTVSQEHIKCVLVNDI